MTNTFIGIGIGMLISQLSLAVFKVIKNDIFYYIALSLIVIGVIIELIIRSIKKGEKEHDTR